MRRIYELLGVTLALQRISRALLIVFALIAHIRNQAPAFPLFYAFICFELQPPFPPPPRPPLFRLL